MTKEFSEADVLNRIEARLRSKKRRKGVSDREKRLLSESYYAFGVPVPKDIGRML